MKLNTFAVTFADTNSVVRMGVRELSEVFSNVEFPSDIQTLIGARASDIPARISWADGTKIVYTPMYLEVTKVLYRFTFDVRRMGTLEGVFISTQAEVENAIGRTIRFGEALGKHSQIDCVLSHDHLESVSTDQVFIEKLESIMTSNVSGWNPIERLREQDEENAWDG